MARARASRGKGGSGSSPERSGSGGSGGTRQRRRQSPAPSPRPTPQRRKRSEKAGSFTKEVQRNKTSRFLSEVVAELRKVNWPDRATLLQSTAVVIVVVAIVSAYLAVLDEGFERLVGVIF
jgi:preprotein translocase subunit SecE